MAPYSVNVHILNKHLLGTFWGAGPGHVPKTSDRVPAITKLILKMNPGAIGF